MKQSACNVSHCRAGPPAWRRRHGLQGEGLQATCRSSLCAVSPRIAQSKRLAIQVARPGLLLVLKGGPLECSSACLSHTGQDSGPCPVTCALAECSSVSVLQRRPSHTGRDSGPCPVTSPLAQLPIAKAVMEGLPATWKAAMPNSVGEQFLVSQMSFLFVIRHALGFSQFLVHWRLIS